jgi:hypothetical protein
MGDPETFARYAIETYRCWKLGDPWHAALWREKAIEEGELLRIEVAPFRKGSGVEQRQRIAAERQTQRTC